jgi:hypothetical protein
MAWDFSKIPVFSPERAGPPQTSSPLVQPMLVVGPFNDPLEHEADRVADEVMRTPAPEVSIGVSLFSGIAISSPDSAMGAPVRAPVPIQARLETGAADDPLEQEANRAADRVMDTVAPALARPAPRQVAAPAPARVSGAAGEAFRTPGRPLDNATRGFFESRFGHDFSGVRVHIDQTATDSARDIGAAAYTLGQEIVFESGQFAPTTGSGRRLLAHELSHVVQQTTGRPNSFVSSTSCRGPGSPWRLRAA